MQLYEKIKELISEAGGSYKEKSRTIYTTCPSCGQADKFSILKQNGACVCYRGSCEFGKRWFADWLSLTMGIPLAEAKEKLYSYDFKKIDIGEKMKLNLQDNFSSREKESDLIDPIRFPEDHMFPIDFPDSPEGANYLKGRGVDLELAKKYGIMYSPLYRRVIFPIKMNDRVYGYQGRAIDKVSDGMRMRNNEGFRRDKLVMFLDNLKGSEHVIICEGPINALKFEKVGGAVCTMGKVVADGQREAILQSEVKKVYLALDEDAAREMRNLAEDINLPVYKLDVPQSCILRCQKAGKKPDFGECTFEECEEAVKNARKIDESHLLMYLKEIE